MPQYLESLKSKVIENRREFGGFGEAVKNSVNGVKDDLLKLVDLPVLPTAQYLVQLSGKNFKYFTLIIKI